MIRTSNSPHMFIRTLNVTVKEVVKNLLGKDSAIKLWRDDLAIYYDGDITEFILGYRFHLRDTQTLILTMFKKDFQDLNK